MVRNFEQRVITGTCEGTSKPTLGVNTRGRKKTHRGLNSLGVLQLYRYPCLSWLPAMSFTGMLLVGLAGCEIGLCAFVRPRVPCVPCVSRLPPVSFYR